jgi:hypothetical protein
MINGRSPNSVTTSASVPARERTREDGDTLELGVASDEGGRRHRHERTDGGPDCERGDRYSGSGSS